MAEGARIVFDSEKAMETFMEETWSEESWVSWPTLPAGCSWSPQDVDVEDIERQVGIMFANESGDGVAPIDMVATRWFRTPGMPDGQHLARCVMLIELKNDTLQLAHFNQILRYAEGYLKQCDADDDGHPDLLCCTLIGTGIKPEMLRIARAIPFLSAYEWAVSGSEIYLAQWAGIQVAIQRPERKIDNVVAIKDGGTF